MAEAQHRPSIVLELPPDRWLFCLVCQKPWPCPTSLTQDDAVR